MAKKYHPKSSWQLLDPRVSPSSEAPICPDKVRLHFHLPARGEVLPELEEKPAIVSLPKPSGEHLWGGCPMKPHDVISPSVHLRLDTIPGACLNFSVKPLPFQSL